MQFIDQSADYRKKSVTLGAAVKDGRAQVVAPEGAETLALCFRPELRLANEFDRSINERVTFNDLPTDEKLDLMTAELLPKIYHPALLKQTGKDSWRVRFLVDGSVERVLHMDGDGVGHAPADERAPDVEIETDVVTLMAMLRAAIADFFHNPPDLPSSA